jgi:protein gp138
VTRPQTPSLADFMTSAIASFMDGQHVAYPGRVESYDRATNSCSVQPVIKRGYLDEPGDRAVEALPVINHVPVAYFRAGGFAIHASLSPGDYVLLVIASGSLDKWLRGGGVVDPGDDRRGNLTDAMAIPGIFPLGDAIDGTSDDHMTITAPSGGEIRIGGSSPLVTRAEFLGHTHATAGTGTPSPPIPGTAGSALDFPGTTVLKGG